MPLLSKVLGHANPASTYWYLQAAPELLALVARQVEPVFGEIHELLAPTLQAYFTSRLICERQASPKTVAAYRDTFRLLIGFATAKTSCEPSKLDFCDLDAPLIGAFLDHLEAERHNSARTRNARLAAIHSMFRFAALLHPEHAGSIQRVLAIPQKRFERALISFLTREEAVALLESPTAPPGSAGATTRS